MPTEHYFSQDPSAKKKVFPISFSVGELEIKASGASGTFSADKLDAGTKVLLELHEHFPTSGSVLDLGCGWGPISLALASSSQNLQVVGVDVNQRSLEQTQENAAALGLSNVKTMLDSEVDETFRFDQIWSNPPIRVGKEVLHGLMRKYLPMLTKGGSAWLVVQKQLGAESFERWLSEEFEGFSVDRPHQAKGYRVIRVTR